LRQRLLNHHRRHEGVTTTVRERHGITTGDEADQHGRCAVLGGTVDLQADGAAAAVDERHLALRAGQHRVGR